MAWRVAESLKTLRAQINAAYPNRDKSSDGSIGDARHASRNSDHNPWVKDRNGIGVVTAIDTDEDLSPSIHSIEHIVKAIQASRDPRVKYIIYERRITVPGDITRWKPYNGVNPHDKHAHISVHSDPRLYDDPRPWAIGTGDILEVPLASAAAALRGGSSADPIGETAGSTAAPSTDTRPTATQPPIIPVPVEPVPAPIIEVPAVGASPSEPPSPPTPEESTMTKIGNKLNAMYTAVGATVAGVVAWFSSMPGEVVMWIVAGVVALGVAYMIINALRQNAKDKRDIQDRKDAATREQELKILREKHAQEIQLYSLRSAADPSLNTVTVAQPPPATELPNSDAAS